MHWGLLDYVAAACIIGATVFGIWLALRLAKRGWLRFLLAALILMAAVLVWVELAVGLFD